MDNYINCKICRKSLDLDNEQEEINECEACAKTLCEDCTCYYEGVILCPDCYKDLTKENKTD